MKYLMVEKHRNGYIVIQAEINGQRLERISYLYYGLKESIRKYRKDHGLKGKHLELIIYQ